MKFSLFHNTKRICSNCGMSVPEENLFCEACGVKYEPAEIAQDEIEVPARDVPGWTCSCGGVNDADSIFCTGCGNRKPSGDTSTVAEPNPPTKPTSGWTCGCGNTNDADSMFCTGCGNRKPSGDTPTVAEPNPPTKPASGWTCSCGNTNDEDSAFCISCGSRRMTGPQTPPTTEPPVIEPPVTITPKPNREVPPIPDIMRPLTNNDMTK